MTKGYVMKKLLIICLILICGNIFGLMPLTESEIDGINLIREEDKLARDVYRELYKTWDMEIFITISGLEQIHMDGVKRLIEKYKIEDVNTDDTAGVFKSPYIKKLFTELVKKSEDSAYEALRVAATLEDMYIKDLNDLMDNTENRDILSLYGDLKIGSINHIRAFNREMKEFGRGYQAQFLSIDELRAILLN